MEIEDAVVTTLYGDGILIAEKKGYFGLIATAKGSLDVNYRQYCFPAKWQSGKPVPDTSKKVRPRSVSLGKDPVAVLEQLIIEAKRMKGG